MSTNLLRSMPAVEAMRAYQTPRHWAPISIVFDAITLCASLRLDVIRGENDHTGVGSAFKALALALKTAGAVSGSDIPSTKGVLC